MGKAEIYFITFVLVMSIFSYGFLNQMAHLRYEEQANHQKLVERLQMLNAYDSNGTTLDGVHSSEGYYCVWTKGRNTEDIARTEVHELCHELINRDEAHFCGLSGTSPNLVNDSREAEKRRINDDVPGE